MLIGLDSLPELIMTCFILHNFIKQDAKSNLDSKDVQEQIDANNAKQARFPTKPDPESCHNTVEGEKAWRTLVAFFGGSLN